MDVAGRVPREIVLVLGDTLFDGLSGMPPDVPVFMREDRQLATRIRHHRQKIVLIFSAMRHFAVRLREQGREVFYRRWEEPDDHADLLAALSATGVEVLHAYEPHDRFFAAELQSWAERSAVELRLVRSPMILTPPEAWQRWRKANPRLLMGDFYRFQRERMRLLIDADGHPIGGRWSHDEENRHPLPRHVLPPPILGFDPDEITREVIELVDREFGDHPGRATEFRYGVTHEEAAEWLREFVDERLDRFGPYEDAIPSRERTLFHGVLTPYLNIGLLTPRQVGSAVLRAHRERDLPINCTEGFLRQLVGWREFIFHMDREYGERGWGPEYSNALGGTRRLKPCWWTGETGLPPLDRVIHRAQVHGWCHHIERLMVAGAAMTMCGVHPDEQYRWFMEMFVDSADWVMAPNVYGMSAFADGGLFATKPYVSSSAYLLRMGDDRRGPWCDVWDGLFWSFVARHRSLFEENARTGAMAENLDALEPRRRERIFAAAAEFIARTTRA